MPKTVDILAGFFLLSVLPLAALVAAVTRPRHVSDAELAQDILDQTR